MRPKKAFAAADGNARRQRNPTWSRDELILALDLYMLNPASPPRKGSSEVNELSDILNQIGALTQADQLPAFRNSNGIYMKMMNFRRFDPDFVAEGRLGLTKGGKDEQKVWDDFAGKLPKLRMVAAAIREAALQGVGKTLEIEPDISEAEEGRLLTILHHRRERSRILIESKRRQVVKDKGCLSCEVCEFDFEKFYGKRGEGFIEVHHIAPLHTLSITTKTRLQDLAVLCSNCHRMVHAKNPWLSLDQLRVLVSSVGHGDFRQLM